MRDPHVNSLRYLLKPHETVTFNDPPPIEHETDAFRMRLEGDIATFDMKEHHASEQTARQCVEEWLRAWELDVALHFGQPEIEFVFQAAEVIDHDPPPPGTTHYARASVTASASVQATGSVHRGKYPEPPTHFKFSPDVATMWSRFQGYEQGQEPLASMAYFCLTLFEASAGGRGKAANQYHVPMSDLRKLGRLTTKGGDRRTARKFSKDSDGRPYTPAEIAWIEGAVKALIRRKAEYDSDPAAQLRELTKADLPAT